MEESIEDMAANLTDPMEDPINEAEFLRIVDTFIPYDEAGAINGSLFSDNEIAIRAVQLNLRLLGYSTELSETSGTFCLSFSA